MKSPQSKTWSQKSHASPCRPGSFFSKSKISHLEGFHSSHLWWFFFHLSCKKTRNDAVGNSNRDGCKYWNIRHKYHCWDPQRWRNLFFDDEKTTAGPFDIWKMARWIDMKKPCVFSPRFFFGTPPSSQLTFFCWEGISCCWIWRLMVKCLVSGRILLGAETLRFPWLTWVNVWSWKGLSQVPPCTTCFLDPRIFDVCMFGDGNWRNTNQLGKKKDTEGFPSLPNCLLRFGFLSRIFLGSNAISPVFFWGDLFLFRFFFVQVLINV